MKKFFTIVASAILVGASTFAAITWGDGGVENLAKGATVTVSSNFGAAQTITDDIDGSGWQAKPSTHEFTNDWVLIDLNAQKTFTDLEIKWEASHCKKYSVYVSNDAPTFTEDGEGENAYKKINEDWFNGKTAAATGGDNSEAGYTENITFEKAQTGQYVLIYANEYNGYGTTYGMFMFEVRLANINDRDKIKKLKATQEGNAVAGGEAVNVTLTLLNTIGEEMTDAKDDYDYTLTCDDKAVSIEGNANVFAVKASKAGSYTLKATAKEKKGENTLEATHTFTAAFNWTGVTNIAKDKTIQGRIKAGETDSNPAANAVDGNEETYYQYNGAHVGGDSWLLVDLGDVYMVDAIGASYGDLSGGQCVFGYALEVSDDLNNKIKEGTDYKWDQIDNNTGWEYTNSIGRTSNTISTHVFDTPVKARYIMVRDADNPNGKPCVKEIYVNGELYVTPKATSVEVSVSDNDIVTNAEVTLSAVVKDQYGAEMEGKEITFTCSDENATIAGTTFKASELGNYTVTATCGEISGEIVVRVVTKDEYKYTNANEPLTHTAKIGDQVQTANSFLGETLYISGELPATLEYEFEKPHSFSMLSLRWEAACPETYSLTITYADNTQATTNIVEGRKFVTGYNPTDKIISVKTRAAEGISLENVKKLAFTFTAKAHNYNLQLFGIDAYGVTTPDVYETKNITTYLDQFEYGTMILPFEAEIPEGMGVYSVSSYDNAVQGYKVLSLTQENKIAANTPYIIHKEGETTIYNFVGTAKANDRQVYTNGWLKGVLVDNVIAPVGSYVLLNQNNKLGFYKVATNDIKVNAYHAYLEPKNANEVTAFVFNMDGVDAIENIATSEALVNVYDMNGVLVRKNVKACEALQGLQKGIYVVNGAKKAVK